MYTTKLTNQTVPPFLEFIGGEFGGGYLTPRVEYLHGHDVQAMRQSVDGFDHWKRLRGNKKFVTPQIQEALANVITELDDYEKRYGDRSYGGSHRIRKDEGIRYDQLDDASRQFVDQIRAQDRDEEEWATISWAIDHRLDDINRSFSTVYRSVGGQLRDLTLQAWDMHKNVGMHFWPEHAGLPHQEAMALLREESKKLLAAAKKLQEHEREFGKAVSPLSHE